MCVAYKGGKRKREREERRGRERRKGRGKKEKKKGRRIRGGRGEETQGRKKGEGRRKEEPFGAVCFFILFLPEQKLTGLKQREVKTHLVMEISSAQLMGKRSGSLTNKIRIVSDACLGRQG